MKEFKFQGIFPDLMRGFSLIIMAVLFTFAIASMIAPVSAYAGEHFVWNGTAYIDGTVVAGDTMATVDPAFICGKYGRSPSAYPYTVRIYDMYCTQLPNDWASLTQCYRSDTATNHPGTITVDNVSANPTWIYFAQMASCDGGYGFTGWRAYNYYNNSVYIPVLGPGINFTATPILGFTPLLVNFTATMNTTPSIVKWNFGDGFVSNTSTSSKSALHTYSAVGTYTVRLDTYDSTYGWQNFTMSEYITATNPSGVVVNLDVKNSITGALISDVSVGIKNGTTGVWRNSTAATGLVYFDSTDPGFLYPLTVNQSITLAANKTGYQPASTTFSIPYDNYRAYLYLVPATVVNATGAGTVVATVVRNGNGVPISGVSITLDTGQMGITNSAGAVTLANVTAGTRYATSASSGYQTTSQSFTLTAGETKMILIQMLLDGETPVATYAPVTTTDALVDTDGDGIGDTPSSVVGNYTPGQLNQKGSSGLMEMIGMVIGLWPLIVIFGFLKFMRSAME